MSLKDYIIQSTAHMFKPIPQQYEKIVAERWPIMHTTMKAFKTINNWYDLISVRGIIVGYLFNGELRASDDRAARFVNAIDRNYHRIFGIDSPPKFATRYVSPSEFGGTLPDYYQILANDVVVEEIWETADEKYLESPKKWILATYDTRQKARKEIAKLPIPIADEILEQF